MSPRQPTVKTDCLRYASTARCRVTRIPCSSSVAAVYLSIDLHTLVCSVYAIVSVYAPVHPDVHKSAFHEQPWGIYTNGKEGLRNTKTRLFLNLSMIIKMEYTKLHKVKFTSGLFYHEQIGTQILDMIRGERMHKTIQENPINVAIN